MNLDVYEMLRTEASGDFSYLVKPVFIFDSNAFKYKYGESDARVLITNGVRDELLKLVDVFPSRLLDEQARILRPEVVVPLVSQEREKLILRASRKVSKNIRTRVTGPGWFDAQQISYAIDLAEDRNLAVMVSNDRDIYETVDEILRKREDLRGNLFAVSVRRYFGKIYERELRGLDRKSKIFLLKRIEERHQIAC